MTLPAWKIDGTLAAAEREAVVQALDFCDQNITETAVRLQVSRSTMYRLIARYHIKVVSKHAVKASQQTRAPRRAKGNVRGEQRPAVGRIVYVEDKWFMVSDGS